MRPITKSFSYLIRNPYSYCFRLIVPKDLQKFVGKKELRYSLKTGYIGVAKQKSRFLAGQLQLIFRYLRKGGAILSRLTDDQIQELVQKYIRNSIESWDRDFYEKPDDDHIGNTPFESIEFFDDIRDQFISELNAGDFRNIEDSVKDLLEKNRINGIDQGSLEYRKLCAEILKAEIQLMPLQKKHMLCDFSYKEKLFNLFPGAYPTTTDPIGVVEIQSSDALSKVIGDFWNEKERTYKERSKPEIKRALDHFMNNLGAGTPIHSVDGQVIREYKQKLMGEEYRPGKTRSIKTINDKYLCYVKALLSFAKDNDYIKDNPAKGLMIKDRRKKRAHKLQDVFAKKDLEKMFCKSPEFGEDSLEKPHYFWIPLIGLYTGMRLEEICQLYVSDLKQIDGIWCLDVLEEEENPDKSIKTGESRLVPLHPFLVKELNFIGYVKNLPDQTGRIFPETNRVANRYGHNFTMWFSQFRKRCLENVKPRRKTFHSLRHTLKTHLAERGADVLYNHYFTGHTTKAIGDDYIKPKPKLIYEKAVLKIDWDLDFSHLKKSKFVPR